MPEARIPDPVTVVEQAQDADGGAAVLPVAGTDVPPRRLRTLGTRRRLRPQDIIANAILVACAFIMVLPFLWQISLSLQTLGESQTVPPTVLPKSPQWGNYAKVFEVLPDFGRMLLNTAIVAVGKTLGITIVSMLTGYAFARLRFPGRGLLFGVFLSMMMMPGALFILPQYEIVTRLGWLNTLQGIIVPGLTSVFSIFLMRQFFMQIPFELEEAARIDGASVPQVFWHIMAPLARPAVSTVAILSMLAAWNELLWPLIVNNDPKMFVAAVGLASLKGQYTVDILTTMAATTIATAPILIIFLLMQRRIIEGMSLGAGLKG